MCAANACQKLAQHGARVEARRRRQHAHDAAGDDGRAVLDGGRVRLIDFEFGGVNLHTLGYADDAALIDGSTAVASERVSSIAQVPRLS